MSPERHKIVIFSGNCHLGAWSVAGGRGCLREEDMMPDNMSLGKHLRYYPDMFILEKSVSKILTNHGGVQKETYILKVYCITLRNDIE